MTWFRSHLGLGSRLALLAVAIQFVLAFGHSHALVRGTLQANAESSFATCELTGSHQIGSFEDPQSCAVQQPLDQGDRDGQRTDLCAVCAVMALAAASIPASSPSLALPDVVAFSIAATAQQFVSPGHDRLGFQPRAPPAA